MNVAWGITGAGHYIEESFGVLEKLSKKHNITTFLSRSGEEVVKAYGLWGRLKNISPGGHMKEIVKQKDQGFSAPITGRFFLEKYDLLVVSPTTSNTVAKIVHGISDTLITNAVSNAMKSMTKVYIVPVDKDQREIRTTLPYYIDKGICVLCSQCEPANTCELKAISDFRIDLLRCNSCGLCKAHCEYGAIVGNKKVKMKVRSIDAENVKKLKKMDFITIVDRPEKLDI